MATTTSPANAATARPANQPLKVPPADTVWTKYSAHNEAPLSAIGSIAIHGIVLGFMLFYVLVLLGRWISVPAPLPIETIRMPSGGGGHAKGSGNAPGVGIVGGEEVPEGQDPVANDQPLTQRPPLDVPEAEAIKREFDSDPTAQRFVDAGNENMKMLARLDKELRDKLRSGVNPPPGKGQGGTGSGGGKGTGEGVGSGPGKGDGRILNEREKRMLRWSMSFDTRNGMDYLNQLAGLGAIIAVPTGDGKQYKTCDLSKKPFKLVDDDLSNMKRIYWMDDKPESVQNLLGALGVRARPTHFVAFMPQSLEEQLAQKELEFRGLREDQIYETKFKCIRHRDGKYEVVVTGQTPK